jgi:hypothetical protein
LFVNQTEDYYASRPVDLDAWLQTRIQTRNEGEKPSPLVKDEFLLVDLGYERNSFFVYLN